ADEAAADTGVVDAVQVVLAAALAHLPGVDGLGAGADRAQLLVREVAVDHGVTDVADPLGRLVGGAVVAVRLADAVALEYGFHLSSRAPGRRALGRRRPARLSRPP